MASSGRVLLSNLLLLAALFAILGRTAGAQHVAPTEALTPAEQQQKFHLPPGFEIQLFAAEPDIHKPMNMAFDSQGRLWVTDTLEYPYPAQPGTPGRDSVKVLADRDQDGRADDITTFVDQLNIPLGIQPIQGGTLVYSIPNLYRCLDTDGDGKADQRDVLYGNFGFRDTHGMVSSLTRGLDGWVYATHGFHNTSTPQGTDNQAITMQSGNTFRLRVDGRSVEYFTHGQVNPFGLAFDPLGNLYSADCHTLPIYMLLRGAYYPSFGKAHDGLDFGPTMIGHDHGSTGIGGLAYYAAEHFPPEYRETIFIGNPVTGKVNHDRLEPHGSSYKAIELPDFVTCDDPWFRPVNLQLGPDGALYIADFYNRIIGHYEVPLDHPGRDRHRGRIWRVVYTGKGVENPPATRPAGPAPDIARATTEQLMELLADANLTVRTLATHELVDRIGAEAVQPVTRLLTSDGASPWQRVHGLWVLERLSALTPDLVERLANDADRAVRVHLVKALAERPSWHGSTTATLVLGKLSDADPFVRRAAADALARHPSAENVRPLLDLWAATAPDDTHLIHATRMALRDQLLQPEICSQIDRLVGADRALRERLANVSLGAATAEAAKFLWGELRGNPGLQTNEPYLHHVARHCADSLLPEVYGTVLELRDVSPEQQAGAVRAIRRAMQERGAKTPEAIVAWAAKAVHELLAADQEARVRLGIELARDFNPPAAFDSLATAAGPVAKFGGLRPAAIDACVACDANRAVTLLSGIVGDVSEPLAMRKVAAAGIARINTPATRETLAAHLQTAPEGLDLDLAIGLAESPEGAELLLATIAAGKASPRLLQEEAVHSRIRARNLPDVETRLSELTAGLPPRDQRVRELIEHRRQAFSQAKADLSAGAAVFQKQCATCHRIGEQGAKIGPNLDGIGTRGLERLLEDVLDPNRNVDQAFRTVQVVTTDGRILSGLPLREEGKVLVIADGQGKEVRIEADEIDERSASALSLMPANVAEQISEADFANLLHYLLSQKQAKQP